MREAGAWGEPGFVTEPWEALSKQARKEANGIWALGWNGIKD